MPKARITIIHNGLDDPEGFAQALAARIPGENHTHVDLERTCEWVVRFTGWPEQLPGGQALRAAAATLAGDARSDVLLVDPTGPSIAEAFARAEHPAGTATDHERIAELQAEIAELERRHETNETGYRLLAQEHGDTLAARDQLERDLAVVQAQLLEANGLADRLRGQRDRALAQVVNTGDLAIAYQAMQNASWAGMAEYHAELTEARIGEAATRIRDALGLGPLVED